MMRALQKRSDSHPTKGENRMKGRTMMAPSGYSRSPCVPYSHTPRGISRNWAPFSLKEFCAWISTSRQKAPQGTLSTGPGVWESCFMKSYAWFLRFSGFSTGFRTRQGGPAKGACPRSLTFPRVTGKPEEPRGPHPRGSSVSGGCRWKGCRSRGRCCGRTQKGGSVPSAHGTSRFGFRYFMQFLPIPSARSCGTGREHR